MEKNIRIRKPAKRKRRINLNPPPPEIWGFFLDKIYEII